MLVSVVIQFRDINYMAMSPLFTADMFAENETIAIELNFSPNISL